MIQSIRNWWNGGKPQIVCIYEAKVNWTDVGVEEDIRYFFFEYPNGKMFYEIKIYGYCKIYKMQEHYIGKALEYYYMNKKKKNVRS